MNLAKQGLHVYAAFYMILKSLSADSNHVLMDIGRGTFTPLMQTILIIEDHRDLRENTAELLALHHFQVFTAANGSQGFALARQVHPNLILCDLVMPQTDGWGLLQLVKTDETTRHIPIVFFSAGSTFPALKKQQLKQAGAYLSKPFSEQQLLSAIKTGLQQNGWSAPETTA